MAMRLPIVLGVVLAFVVGHTAQPRTGDAQTLPGLLVVNLSVKDPAQFQAYAEKTAPILAAHKGTPLFRASNPTVLAGEHPHKMLIGFRFPSKAAVTAFYNSPEYQALIPLRSAAADVIFTAYEIDQEGPPAEAKALLAVNILVKDAGRFGEYGKAAQPLVQAHGGSLQFRAINPDVLFGQHRYKTLVLFRFPSQEAIRSFYSADAYQKLIPVRTAGAETVFTGYDL